MKQMSWLSGLSATARPRAAASGFRLGSPRSRLSARRLTRPLARIAVDDVRRRAPARLGELAPGDEVVVTTDDEEVRYVIERVDSYPKTVIDLDAVFDRTGSPRLHLVTCGGEWDPAAGSYEDNVIAVAVRTDVS